MISINKKLLNIEEYKPSNRVYEKDVKKLDWNECNIPFESEFTNILNKSLHDINFSEYPNINNLDLINKLSLYCDVDQKNIQTFNGSDSALHYIFATFLNTTTKVLIFYPNYNQIESYIHLYSDYLNYSKIKNIFKEHEYNFDDIINNDVIYISNPNNPTGFLLDSKVIENLVLKYNDKLFIIDEAYYEFSNKSCVNLVKKYDNIIVTRTFSKALSLASVRLGYICASETLILQINKIRNTKEVNTFAQILGLTCLNNFDYIKNRINKINTNKHLFQENLKEIGINFVESNSNFVLIQFKKSKQLINDLLKNKILIRDRSMFEGLDNCVRISIGELSDMELILKKIKNLNNENK
jgi:histidinol-phosphate aminotransferase